jgi:hypothetical protein
VNSDSANRSTKPPSPREVERDWPEHLRLVLGRSPAVENLAFRTEPVDGGLDGEADFYVNGKLHRLLIECKSIGQPRQARAAALQLGEQMFRENELTRGVFVAPFISPAAREELASTNIGWLDFAGNARIAFPDLHMEIERTNSDPFTTKREQRSLFAPKSARILKVMLEAPTDRPWKVNELAWATGVSVGQVSNVRQALLERDLASADQGGGVRLTRQRELLDLWRDSDPRPPEVWLRAHTVLHGTPLDKAIEQAMIEASAARGRLIFASHSAARRLAPFTRVPGEYFYADAIGLGLLSSRLKLTSVAKGENITVFAIDDESLEQHPDESVPGRRMTSPVQTYLDLLGTGERGREAAEHWRALRLEPLWAEEA